jgi:hypothetical protein
MRFAIGVYADMLAESGCGGRPSDGGYGKPRKDRVFFFSVHEAAGLATFSEPRECQASSPKKESNSFLKVRPSFLRRRTTVKHRTAMPNAIGRY